MTESTSERGVSPYQLDKVRRVPLRLVRLALFTV